jgi:hypothetical protein
VSDSSDKTSGLKPYEIIVVKHIPNRTPYTPADRIIVRYSWGPGDGRDYATVFQDLNEESARDVLEWNNPATSAQSRIESNATQNPTPSSSASIAKSQLTTSQPSTPTPEPPQKIMQPDPVALERSPGWKTHSTGKGEWTKAIEQSVLREYLLGCKDKTAVLGNFRYKLWGSSDDMLSRWRHTGRSETKQ